MSINFCQRQPSSGGRNTKLDVHTHNMTTAYCWASPPLACVQTWDNSHVQISYAAITQAAISTMHETLSIETKKTINVHDYNKVSVPDNKVPLKCFSLF